MFWYVRPKILVHKQKGNCLIIIPPDMWNNMSGLLENRQQLETQRKLYFGRPSVIPKAKYMTLGPKFFCCSKMAVTRRRSKLW